jgi:hypothetical protein
MNPINIQINFFTPFQDFHLVSQDYIINKSILENWTLHRLKVPDFKDRDEMKDWIIAIDFIVKSESFFISGPSFPYYYAVGEESYYTKPITIEDANGVIYHIPERNYYNKNEQPLDLLDTKVFYNYLNQEIEAYLNTDSYGSCFSIEKVDGKYFFKDVKMCGIVEFLGNNEPAVYSPPKDQLIFGINTEDYSFEGGFDGTNVFWTFENIQENNQVFVIEFKYIEAKKEEQIDYFNSWIMWHEKFIHDKIMYFVLFQTDEINGEKMTEYFSPLIKTISKRYRVNSYILERQSYYEFKLGLRNLDLNDK